MNGKTVMVAFMKWKIADTIYKMQAIGELQNVFGK